MQLFTVVSNLETFLQSEKKAGHKIAFIPTMGALHEGHLSLIKIGKKLADITVCSIYVNPSQFNNKKDLIKYPRSLENDARMLETDGCNVLFAPSDKEIYPQGMDSEVRLELGILDQVMEGKFRPGHFKGMLQVVKRLLDLIQPDYLVMGQKDFQQFSLVHHMIDQLQLPLKLIIGPTLREKDGLAMSSRNQRLSEENRQNAIIIYQCLLELNAKLNEMSIPQLEINTMEMLIHKGFKPEYVEIVDGFSLQKITSPQQHKYIVACIAVWAGEVRLIDNLILKGERV